MRKGRRRMLASPGASGALFIKALFNSRLYFAYIMSVRLLSKMLGRTAMRVLVVEDNALLRHHLKVQLQELGHQVDAAEDAGKRTTIWANISRISPSSISACRMKTVYH